MRREQWPGGACEEPAGEGRCVAIVSVSRIISNQGLLSFRHGLLLQGVARRHAVDTHAVFSLVFGDWKLRKGFYFISTYMMATSPVPMWNVSIM